MKIKLILLAIATGLLIISIKYFPYHCNSKACQAEEVSTREVGEVGTESNIKIIPITLGSITIKAEVRDTEEGRGQGLSGREELKEGEGMLFVFPEAGKHGFWMKDMRFPIDIIWIEENKVVGISSSVLPSSYPEIFYPPVPVKQVLEVAAGTAYRHNVKVGDFISIGH